MIHVDSLVIVFMIEVIAVLLSLVGVVWFLSIKIKSKARSAALTLIEKINKNEQIRTRELNDLLTKDNIIDPETVQNILTEINRNEKALYQQIIEIFINRDNKLLSEIDHRVRELSDPYCKFLIDRSDTDDVDSTPGPEIESANAEIARLKSQGEKLSEHLRMALETVDNVSSEFTKLYSGTGAEDELNQARLRMLYIYTEAENKVTHAFQKDIKSAIDDGLVEHS